MVYFLIALFLLGAFVSNKAGLFGKRRITPRAVPEMRPERRVFAPIYDEPPDPDEIEPASPAADATPVGQPAYLLDGRLARTAPDRMAATMAMMAGPGICTPGDG